MDVEPKKKDQDKQKDIAPQKKAGIAITGYILISVICAIVYALLRVRKFGLSVNAHDLLLRLTVAGFVISLVFIVTRVIEVIIAKRSPTKKVSYNMIRLVRLLSVLAVIFVLVTFLFEKWYTAAVSLGLFSLIMGFALQTPISSLIGWFYIIIRSPYRIGDRIQVGSFTGDVVEISYLDTTLWEFHGHYLSQDVPSGRLIRFPNTLVLQSEVYNYSWKKFPFIWNEISFHIAYDSDFNYVEKVIRDIAAKETDPEVQEDIAYFKSLVMQTPIDHLDIKELPFVSFRINANTWVEVTLTYIVHPKKAAGLKTRLVKAIVTELQKDPGKTRFPKGDAR